MPLHESHTREKSAASTRGRYCTAVWPMRGAPKLGFEFLPNRARSAGGGALMRPICRIAFALFLPRRWRCRPSPPNLKSPDALIGRTEAVRIAIQNSSRPNSPMPARQEKTDEQGALVEYYSVAENRLLWVDENGLNDRAKSVIEEIGKADDYGLRASDYELPKCELERARRRQMARRRRDQDQLRRAGIRARRPRRPHQSAALEPESRSGARAAQSHGSDRIDLHPL